MKTGADSYEERVAEERREEGERNEKTKALILQVLKILEFKQVERKEDSWHSVYIDAKKGEEQIHFSSGSYQMKDRIRISGSFPKTEKGEMIDPYRYGEKRHEITVSVKKTPDQIAKDIKRRFLPRYRVLLGEVIEKIKRANDYAKACRKNLEEIKGEPLSEYEAGEHTWRLTGSVYGDVRVDTDSARIEIHSVPIEIAKQIMALVKNYD